LSVLLSSDTESGRAPFPTPPPLPPPPLIFFLRLLLSLLLVVVLRGGGSVCVINELFNLMKYLIVSEQPFAPFFFFQKISHFSLNPRESDDEMTRG